MIDWDSKFFMRSRDVARRFLRSVVLADDRAFDQGTSAPTELNSPETPDDAIASPALPGTSDSSEETASERDSLHAFDAATITRSFARAALLATVVPISDVTFDDDVDTVVALARRADVLSLDWRVGNRTGGEFPLAVLARVRMDDLDLGGRLRLVVIYTGDEDLVEVANSVRAGLGVEAGVDTNRIEEGHTRYVVLGKPTSRHEGPDRVAYDALPARIVDEFTALTAGLLSNLALRGFAELRDRTHVVLAKTTRDLDAAYIAHRVHCNPMGAAEDFALDLLVDECGSLLRDAGVEEEVGLDAIRDRMRLSEEPTATLLLAESRALPLGPLLSQGADKLEPEHAPQLSKSALEKWQRRSHVEASRLFAERLGGSSADELNERFAVFSTHVAVAARRVVLTLGTLVMKTGEDRALVCLQPRCDAVRVETTGFVFASATPNNNEFELVVCVVPGQFKRFRIEFNAKSLRTATFKGNPNSGLVEAIEADNALWFTDTSGAKYRYLGQLKNGVAQRFANEFAAKLVRVGVDTFEWLRRSEPRGR